MKIVQKAGKCFSTLRLKKNLNGRQPVKIK